MNYFPLFFDLRGQRVLVVGAGAVALRKVQLLERAQAAITVVAPQVAPELAPKAARLTTARMERRRVMRGSDRRLYGPGLPSFPEFRKLSKLPASNPSKAMVSASAPRSFIYSVAHLSTL